MQPASANRVYAIVYAIQISQAVCQAIDAALTSTNDDGVLQSGRAAIADGAEKDGGIEDDWAQHTPSQHLNIHKYIDRSLLTAAMPLPGDVGRLDLAAI